MKATPEKLKRDIETVSALIEAFDTTYMDVCEFIDKKATAEEKNKACCMMILIRDFMEKLEEDVNELCEHEEVCNAILASRLVERGLAHE